MKPKAWEILSTDYDRSFRVFRLRTDRARSPRTGKDHRFFVLESPTWVNVIPLTPEGNVVLVRQYRHGTREVTLEIPGGVAEEGDTPEGAARRELREETGWREENLISLGYVTPNPAIQNNRCYTFLADGVVPAGDQEQDDKEDIEVVLRPLAEIPRMIREGEIHHSLVIAAFYRLFMECRRGPSDRP